MVLITPEDFDPNAEFVFGTYEGKGFWQNTSMFTDSAYDYHGEPFGYTKKAYDLAEEALSFQARQRKYIIANTEEQLLKLIREQIEMN